MPHRNIFLFLFYLFRIMRKIVEFKAFRLPNAQSSVEYTLGGGRPGCGEPVSCKQCKRWRKTLERQPMLFGICQNVGGSFAL